MSSREEELTPEKKRLSLKLKKLLPLKERNTIDNKRSSSPLKELFTNSIEDINTMNNNTNTMEPSTPGTSKRHQVKPSIVGEDFPLKLEDLSWLNDKEDSAPGTPGSLNEFIVKDREDLPSYDSLEPETEEEEKNQLLDLQLDPIQKKRNIDFHINFPSLPLDDILIEDYHCALQKDILVTGRLYLTSERICFHSNLFGWVNHTIIPFKHIVSLQKRSTAFVIPNAIQIITLDQKYFFTSFMARDTVFCKLYELWSKKCPNRAVEPIRSNTVNEDTNNGTNVNENSSSLCPCLKMNSSHEGYLNLDTTYSVNIKVLFELLFGEDNHFMKEYLEKTNNNVEFKEWKDDKREIHYIKPLSNPLGPKQTRVNIIEEIVTKQEDSYMVQDQSKNPDVPSGDAFTVNTRYCFMISNTNQCRLVITTWLEWSKSSWFKGPIEAGTKDGTTKAAQELDEEIKNYISNNPHLITIAEGVNENNNNNNNNNVISAEKGSNNNHQIQSKDKFKSILYYIVYGLAILLMINMTYYHYYLKPQVTSKQHQQQDNNNNNKQDSNYKLQQLIKLKEELNNFNDKLNQIHNKF
ncbi:GRAM-domain-containing protein [Neoconidiobolus thromboides FSU 785]|nr:GRAM-domain-containing protein [Neoconidiobolus thromboides FSU 785]